MKMDGCFDGQTADRQEHGWMVERMNGWMMDRQRDGCLWPMGDRQIGRGVFYG